MYQWLWPQRKKLFAALKWYNVREIAQQMKVIVESYTSDIHCFFYLFKNCIYKPNVQLNNFNVAKILLTRKQTTGCCWIRTHVTFSSLICNNDNNNIIKSNKS